METLPPLIVWTTHAADDEPALLAAASLASSSGARLVSLHATADATLAERSTARVAALEARWQRTIQHTPTTHVCCDDTTDTLLDALRRLSPALVVSGTHGKSGWLQLFSGSVAEGIARNVQSPTLIVPDVSRSFVDEATGTSDLRRVLVPAGDPEAMHAGIRAAEALTRFARVAEVELVLLHVEDGRPAPAPPPESVPASWRVVARTVNGPLEDAILEAATTLEACVVVMPTRGHDGLLDVFAGSHTERVVRRSRCPVLSVPL